MAKSTDPRDRIINALMELNLDPAIMATIKTHVETGSPAHDGDRRERHRPLSDGADADPLHSDGQNDSPAKLAQRLLRASHRRGELLGQDLVSDPAWHMLLDLYAARAQGKQVTVSSLCAASGSPVTTALRYLDLMTQRGLITRRSDLRDARRVLIEPTPHATRLMSELIRSYTEVP